MSTSNKEAKGQKRRMRAAARAILYRQYGSSHREIMGFAGICKQIQRFRADLKLGGYALIAEFVAQERVKKFVPPIPTNVTGDTFLSTYEWRRVRMLALKKYGARCQCCGATPGDGVKMNVDHIKPRKLFPALALDVTNLQVLCDACNHGKGNWDMTDWRGNASTSSRGVEVES